MGQVEATMAALRDTVRRHRRSLRHYLDTHTAFVEKGMAHGYNRNNPHRVSKDQVGLGHLMNYPIADVPTIPDSDKYMDIEGAIAYVQQRLGQSQAFDVPNITSPMDGETVQSTRPIVEAWGYTNAYGIPRLYREWRLISIDTGETITAQTQTDHWAMDQFLTDNSQYKLSVRDVATDHSASKWSAWSYFTVPVFSVDAPVISSLEPDLNEASLSPTFMTSEFSADSPDAVHQETQWAIYEGNVPDPVWSLTSTASHLLSVSVPTRVLSPSTRYRLEVTHVGVERGASDPGVLMFQTRDVSVTSPIAELRGQDHAASLWPVFDVPPMFEVVGDDAQFVSMEASLYLNDILVWAETYAEEPLQIAPSVTLQYNSDYRLVLVYKAEHYGASDPFELTFTTTTGGSRGYLTDQPVSPVGDGYFAVNPSNTWLESRGNVLRAHTDGDTDWTLALSDTTIHGLAWSVAHDGFLVLYVPTVGSHRLVVGCLGIEGDWKAVLSGVDLPTGTTVDSMTFHGQIDGILRFSATTSSGVCYFTQDPVSGTVSAKLLTSPTGYTAEGRFSTVMGDRLISGLLLTTPTGPEIALMSYNTTTAALAVRTHTAASAITDWGYGITARDSVNGQLTVDRGDQVCRVGIDLSVLSIVDVARLGQAMPDSGMRSYDRSSLVRRTVADVGYTPAGVIKYTNGTPVSIRSLVGVSDTCTVEHGSVGPNELRLAMKTPDDVRVFVNGFDYDELEGSPIPEMAGFAWEETDLTTMTRTSITPMPVSGFQMVPLSTLDNEDLLIELYLSTTTSTPWETLSGFYQ